MPPVAEPPEAVAPSRRLLWLGSLGELGVAAGVATPAILFLAGKLAVVAAILGILADEALASGVGAFAYLRKRRHVLLRYQN